MLRSFLLSFIDGIEPAFCQGQLGLGDLDVALGFNKLRLENALYVFDDCDLSDLARELGVLVSWLPRFW